MSRELRTPHVLGGQTILIIEDDALLLRSLMVWFQQAGCSVFGAKDGVEGLAQFKQHRPHVVISEIVMPNREGVETIMAIKALAPSARILAISGGGRIGSTDLLSLAHALGADAVMAKPFRSADIVGAVARLVQPAVGAPP